MNVDVFRHFYGYHFAENRKLWDRYIAGLSDAQFMQEVDYSHGSVRNQIAHLISVDHAWFSDLRGVQNPDWPDPSTLTDRHAMRALWDGVEQEMRDYLAALRDEQLSDKPLEGEDEALTVWQVLLQVVNHGTDHRAQILRQLHDMGIETAWQDYIFYVYGNP